MWKIDNISATQILRENEFDNLAASKIAILKGLESLEIEFVIFQVRKNSQICQKSNVRATKTVKNAKFEVLIGMKLISHKI